MSSASSTFASGGSPTAAQVNGWAQGTLGYAQVTANQGSITTEVDLTSLTVTVTLVAGRQIRITGYANFSNSVSNDGAFLIINEGATRLNLTQGWHTNAGVGFGIVAQVVLNGPSAGSHTYKLRSAQQTGGTVTLVASSTSPAFILVEDIGAV